MSSFAPNIAGHYSAALAAALFVCHLAPLFAQEAAKPEPRTFDYTGSDGCINCHSDTAKMKDHADFIGVAPAKLWSEFDKHGESFQLLQGKSRQLTNRILGFDLREAFADDEFTSLSEDEKLAAKVSTVKSCLRCHATWPKAAEAQAENRALPIEPLSLGVSCQACHGPAGYWTEPHQEKWWRLVSHEGKSKLGFANVRDAAARTELCASCHIGNVAEEKFVKHQWYAAGHPPLPGFESSAFAAQMPAHWKPLRDKPDFDGRTSTSKAVPDGKAKRAALRRRNIDIAEADVKASYREANFPEAKDDAPLATLPRTQEVTLSGAVVLKAYAGIAAGYADEAAKGNKQFPWPEFALYDCASCHHELRREDGLVSRPRQSSPPGRPPMPRWTSALLSITGERNVELATELRSLQSSFTQRPFGDPAKIVAAAKKLQPRLDEMCRDLSRTSFDEERAGRSLNILLGTSTTAELHDYASARQVAWAIQALRLDLAHIPYGFDAQLTGEQQQDQDRILALFRRGDRDALFLTLPARKENSVVGELPKFLQAMGEYDADWFAQRLKEMKSSP